MNYGFIYETTNLINGMKYIGSHVRSQDSNDPDDSWYLGSGTIFCRALEKYGPSNFSRKILYECSSKEELIVKEKEYLLSVDAANNYNYYNLINDYFGGDCKGENSRMYGKVASDETKEKHRQRMISSNPMSNPETRKKVSESQKGKKRREHANEEKENQKIRMTEWNQSEKGLKFRESMSIKFSGESNPFYNHKHTPESLELIGATNRGTVYVNNGIVNKRIKPELLSSYINNGYSLGMLPRNKL